MSFLRRNLRPLLAGTMLLLTLVLYIFSYLPAQRAFEAERERLSEENEILREAVLENLRYAAQRPQIDDATRALRESRAALYRQFPTALREEDQLLFVLSLERRFGTPIDFDFGAAQPIAALTDGAELGGVTLTVNYETTYCGFKDMLRAIASDARVTSIRSATMDYDARTDTLRGELTILCYTLDTGAAYTPPTLGESAVGKSDLFH